VSFGSPQTLVALAFLPALVAWYVSRQAARRRAARAFVTPALFASVAPRRSSWRRHLPMLVILLALAALIVAAARPQTTVAVPAERASIMLLTDVSGSMLATDVKPSRLTAARRAAKRFVDNVPRKVNVGVMAFNQVPQVLQTPTTDRAAVEDALDRLAPSGGTATGEAIQSATRILQTKVGTARTHPPAAIVLLSDGASTRGVDPVQAATVAGKAKIPVYTVALGTQQGTITVPRPGGQGGTETRRVPPDLASLKRISDASGARAFSAVDSAKLDEVYEKLGSQLGRKDEKREITSSVAGGGLALLLLGSTLSLALLGRPI
jgi:Ca-activated chloride channel family protein